MARVVCIADAFDAMISDRPYRSGMEPGQALAEIEANAGTQFDPFLARAFVPIVRREYGLERTPYDPESIAGMLKSISSVLLQGGNTQSNVETLLGEIEDAVRSFKETIASFRDKMIRTLKNRKP
jgi:hypothetical protein